MVLVMGGSLVVCPGGRISGSSEPLEAGEKAGKGCHTAKTRGEVGNGEMRFRELQVFGECSAK